MSRSDGILIFGASGLIGRYLRARLAAAGHRVVGTCHRNHAPGLVPFDLATSVPNELNLGDFRLAVIAGAVTKLDQCRNDPDHSHAVNVEGTQNLLRVLWDRGVFPVFLSSASVFDGVRGNYREDAPLSPPTLYGRQKAQIEKFIADAGREALILRPGKVFGLQPGEGVLFADWWAKYCRGEPIRLADDEQLSPVWVEDVARGIEVLIERECRGIYHVNPPRHLSRFAMASRFFRHLGVRDARLVRCSIDDFDFAERRPRNTYLDAAKFIRETGFVFTELEDLFDRMAESS